MYINTFEREEDGEKDKNTGVGLVTVIVPIYKVGII